MAAIVPQAAENDTLTQMVNNFLNTAKMHLIGTSMSVGSGTTLANLNANEATFTGYAAAALTSWTTPAIDGSGASISTTTQGLFTGTGAGGTGNVYGYYITDSGNTKFYLCEIFGSAISAGQNIGLEIDYTHSYLTRF